MQTRTSATTTLSSGPSAAAGSHRSRKLDLEKVLVGGALVELIAGFALIAEPVAAVHLVFGPDASDGGIAQFAGIALVALAIACWPLEHGSTKGAVRGLGVFNVTVVVYLIGVRTVVGAGGVLLWPVVALHALIAALIVWRGW